MCGLTAVCKSTDSTVGPWKNNFSCYDFMNEKTEKSTAMDREGSHNDTFHLSVRTEDPDLTEVQLKLVQGAEAHTQGGDGGQGDGVGVNHGH